MIAKRYIMTKSPKYGGSGMGEWFTSVINKSMETLTKEEINIFVSEILMWELVNPNYFPVIDTSNHPHDSFANIMLTAGRYIKANATKYGGKGVAPWFQGLLDKGGCQNISRVEWEMFERHIMAWGMANPEKPALPAFSMAIRGVDHLTQALTYCMFDVQATMEVLNTFKKLEEEKTMTTIQKTTGLKSGEIFTVQGYDNLYRLTEDFCHLETVEPGKSEWTKGDYLMGRIINEPQKIERHLQFTAEQKKKLFWLFDGGFKYLGKDEDDDVYVYTHKPYLCSGTWRFIFAFGEPKDAHMMDDELFPCMESLLADYKTLIDIEKEVKWLRRLDAVTPAKSYQIYYSRNGVLCPVGA
jgi:hypothetical protein